MNDNAHAERLSQPRVGFDELAEPFITANMRRLKELHDFDTVRAREKCVEIAELFQHSYVLDVGTSTGWMAITLAALGHQVVGIDIDVDALASARELAAKFGPSVAERISFLSGTAAELDFCSETFDGVFSFESLHHFPNCLQSLREMLRVCRKGGALVIGDLNERGREVVQEAIMSLTGKTHEVNACRLQDVEQLMLQLGSVQHHSFEFVSIFVIKK